MINISRHIRHVCVRKLMIPALLSVCMVWILINIPFIQIFHPENVTDIYHIKGNDKYINVTTDTLYYSGYNLIKAHGKTYGYYYSLQDQQCIFVLLPITQKPETILKDYTFTAKLISPDKSYQQMLSSFAKDLNWNEKSLSVVTKNYILSNADYHPIIYAFLLWMILITLSVSVKKLITSLIGFLKPDLYPVCTFLGRRAQKELISEAQSELSSENYIQINSMYITENFFIDLGKSQISIIPLNEIVWCYMLGKISFNPAKHDPSYSLCFTILSSSVIIVKHKTSDEALEVINAIRATEYDIIIGHSASKKKMAKKICKEYAHH